MNASSAGMECVATGHGKDGYDSLSFYSPLLRQVTLLKVLSSEMDLAESGINRYVSLKGI
jgi:hypothetical protein